MVAAVVTAFGSAFPDHAIGQEEAWEKFFATHYEGVPVAEKVWKAAGVATRRGAVDPTQEDLSLWSTEARMQRFIREALPLGASAIQESLAAAGLAPSDVELFAAVTCTGYVTPGLDILLAHQLGMAPSTERVHVGHMGCYAAIPGLSLLQDAAVARRKRGVLLCLELASLHLQPATDEIDQVVAHALFADAAAAITVQPDGAGLRMIDVVARTDAAQAGKMTWDITDHGFRMGLSPDVPDVLRRHVRQVVSELLFRNRLSLEDVRGWAIHPGGPKIIDVVGEQLSLTDEQLSVSRRVLRERGNCSSATVLLILERIFSNGDLREGDYVVAMAFGPGLTLYAALLRKTQPRDDSARSSITTVPAKGAR